MGGDSGSDADPALYLGREKERILCASLLCSWLLRLAAAFHAGIFDGDHVNPPTLHGFCALGSAVPGQFDDQFANKRQIRLIICLLRRR